MLQKYFYRFWYDRDPFNTEQSWKNYHNLVKLVNKEFKNGIIDGHLSDRGRIYLSYGSPNSRSQEIMPKRVFNPLKFGTTTLLETRGILSLFSQTIECLMSIA